MTAYKNVIIFIASIKTDSVHETSTCIYIICVLTTCTDNMSMNFVIWKFCYFVDRSKTGKKKQVIHCLHFEEYSNSNCPLQWKWMRGFGSNPIGVNIFFFILYFSLSTLFCISRFIFKQTKVFNFIFISFI